MEVDVKIDSHFGCLKSIQELFNGKEAVMALTLINNSDIASSATVRSVHLKKSLQ